MPAHKDLLGELRVHLLAAYVRPVPGASCREDSSGIRQPGEVGFVPGGIGQSWLIATPGGVTSAETHYGLMG